MSIPRNGSESMKRHGFIVQALILSVLALSLQGDPVSRTFISHEKGVVALDWSPDGEYLATASLDGAVSLWNAEGLLVRKMQIHTKPALGIAFSPDGEVLATASADATVTVFAPSGRIMHRMKSHRTNVLTVAWSPDGRFLASGSEDMTVRIHTKNGSLVSTLTGQMQPVTAVEFSRDGKRLAIAERGVHLLIRETRLWGMEKLVKAHNDVVWDTAVSRDSQFFATCSKDRSLKIWRADGSPHLALVNLPAEVWTIAFSPDGTKIACGLKSGTVLVYALPSGTILHTFSGHKDGVLGVAWSPNGRYLASASRDATVKIWEGL